MDLRPSAELLTHLEIGPEDAVELESVREVGEILASIESTRARHRELGIPDDISWETLSFLGRAMAAYRKRHGSAGIELTHWDRLRFSGWLYQAGRLEFTVYWLCTRPKEAGPLFWYDDEAVARLGPGFRKGDPALGLHVPASGPLAPAECDESLRRIRAAAPGMFPGEPLGIATCTSWMMDEQLAEYLPADSNILAFQRRFEMVPGALDNDDAIRRFVAGQPGTTLGRAVEEHLRGGRHWRLRTGWLELM